MMTEGGEGRGGEGRGGEGRGGGRGGEGSEGTSYATCGGSVCEYRVHVCQVD